MGRARSFSRFSLFVLSGRFRTGLSSVGIVGCGQFSFSTIGYFLAKSGRYRFEFAIDPNIHALESFGRFYGVRNLYNNIDLADFSKIDIIYIASNHFSHTNYAVEAIKNGTAVYVEKPVAVNWDQFFSLGNAISARTCDVYFGYNRPFSQGVQTLKSLISDVDSPFTLSCFVVGHLIDDNHWYRDPKEGTRVCGNLGHWLDLSVHLLSMRNFPDHLDVQLVSSDPNVPDDDLCVTIVSSHGDLINIILTSRAEPFEGINETIAFNQSDLIGSIIDFREARFWKGHRYIRQKYRPKDVGHKKAILQHMNREKYARDIDEVRLSTALMLEIKDMVLTGKKEFRFFPDLEKYRWDRN